MKQPKKPLVFDKDSIMQSMINRRQAESTYVAPLIQKNVVSKEVAPYYQRMAENKDFSATTDNLKIALVKKILPVGDNAASFVNKKITGSNKMDVNSLSPQAKAMLFKIVEQAKIRNGNNYSGGTEYADYQSVMSPKEFSELSQTVKGNVNPIIGGINGKTSEAYDLGTTLGRFSYATDEKGNVIVTDTYDFKNSYTQDKDGKLKKDYMQNDNSVYANLRKNEAVQDQNIQNDKLNNLKTYIPLTQKDTIGYQPNKGSVISTPTADDIKNSRDRVLNFLRAKMRKSK